jgi:RNA recognition motif-containing protein
MTITKRLFVDNLPRSVTGQQVRALFAAHGEVRDVRLLTNGDGETPRGAAIVELTVESAEAAARALDGADVEGRELRVLPARSASPPSASSGER